MKQNTPSLTTKPRHNWLGLASLAAGLLAWWMAARYSGLPSFILPSPAQVWTRSLRALTDGSLFMHAGVTLFEILTGLLVGALAATILGYLVAKSRALERILSPY